MFRISEILKRSLGWNEDRIQAPTKDAQHILKQLVVVYDTRNLAIPKINGKKNNISTRILLEATYQEPSVER